MTSVVHCVTRSNWWQKQEMLGRPDVSFSRSFGSPVAADGGVSFVGLCGLEGCSPWIGTQLMTLLLNNNLVLQWLKIDQDFLKVSMTPWPPCNSKWWALFCMQDTRVMKINWRAKIFKIAFLWFHPQIKSGNASWQHRTITSHPILMNIWKTHSFLLSFLFSFF